MNDCLSVDEFASELNDCLSVDEFAYEFASESTNCLSVDELRVVELAAASEGDVVFYAVDVDMTSTRCHVSRFIT
jgi:hypothetical protein